MYSAVSVTHRSGFAPQHPAVESPIDARITTMPIAIAGAASDWLFAGVPQVPPAAAGAVGRRCRLDPFLERADFTSRRHSAWTHSGSNLGGKLPSEMFASNFITRFIDDAFGMQSTRLRTGALKWPPSPPPAVRWQVAWCWCATDESLTIGEFVRTEANGVAASGGDPG